MKWHVNVANQMDQPGQMHRTFLGWSGGICQGFLGLLNSIQNVVGGIRTRLNWEFRGFQRIIDVVPFGVVVRIVPASNFIWPSALTHENKGGEIEIGTFRGKRLFPFFVVRMGFEDLGYFLLEARRKLMIRLCRDDLVTGAAPGQNTDWQKRRASET